jgi:ATP-dependent helicase/nuclease subunit A
VSLPAAAAPPELGVSFEDAVVQVRVNRPSPERAAELGAVASGEMPATAPAAGPPPIVEPLAPVMPRRPLSYSALQDYRRCGYRFYMERVLGMAATANGAGPEGDAGARFGSAVHSLLEWSAGRRWIEPSREVLARMLEAEGLEAEGPLAQRARAMVRGWIDSPLRAALGGRGTRVRAEVPLLLELGGSIMRGKIDILGEPIDGPPTVIDFKTDGLNDDDPVEHAERYAVQRDLYAVATAAATGAETVRVAYVFLERPAEPVILELGPEEIKAARANLETTVAGLAAGSFEVTGEPDWPLCHDCPARARLCPTPAAPP